MRRVIIIVLTAIGALMATVAIAGTIYTEVSMATVERPDYEVVRAEGAVEIRRYAPMLVASVIVDGTGSDARGDGFRILADYIFGNNRPNADIAMTAPVETQTGKAGAQGEAIAMTAPVESQAQEPAGDGARTGDEIAMTAPVTARTEGSTTEISFIMPAQYTAETLPRPGNPRITISERPAELIAAITFSGVASEADMQEREAALRAFLSDNGIATVGPARFARYDPPWRLPFRRTNEVLIPVAGAGGPGSATADDANEG